MTAVNVVAVDLVDDPRIQQQLWEVYSAAFSDAEKMCIQAQSCYDRSSFIAALQDASYMKFVLSLGDEALGLILATNDLDKARVAYVNPVRLRGELPVEAAEGRIWYVTVLAVAPQAQGKSFSRLLFGSIGAFIEANDGVIAFDFSQEKLKDFPAYSLRLFDELRDSGTLPIDGADYHELGGQRYGIIRFRKKI